MAFDKRSDHRTKYEQATLFTSLPEEVENLLLKKIETNLKSLAMQYDGFQEMALNKALRNRNPMKVYFCEIQYPIKHHIHVVKEAFDILKGFSIDPYPNLRQDLLKIFDDWVDRIIEEWYPKVIKAFEEKKSWFSAEEDFETYLKGYIEQEKAEYRNEVEELAISIRRQKTNGGNMFNFNHSNLGNFQNGNNNNYQSTNAEKKSFNIFRLVEPLIKFLSWIFIKVKTLF